RLRAGRAHPAVRPLHPLVAARDAARARSSARLCARTVEPVADRQGSCAADRAGPDDPDRRHGGDLCPQLHDDLRADQSQDGGLAVLRRYAGQRIVRADRLAGGWLSDVVGRRWMMIVPRVLFFIAAYPVFVLIVDERSTTALLTGTALLSILLNISTGAFYVGFTELLPKRVRGVVFATVYATAISLFGGTTQIFVAWLMHVTGNNLAMSWYLLFATAECMFAMEETAPVRLAREPAA